MTAAWGEGGAEAESVPRRIDLGGGSYIELNPEAFRRLLHSPEVVAALEHRATELCDAANAQAIHVGRPDRPDPKYVVEMENSEDDTRARARVYTQNFQAVLDDALHSTLLKVMQEHPSDPKPHEVMEAGGLHGAEAWGAE